MKGKRNELFWPDMGVTMAKKIIGVFGAGNVTDADAEYQLAYRVGCLLAQNGIVVLTGGLGGIMTAASKGAREAGGVTVGILPGTRKTGPANPYVDIAIYTGMGEARNAINIKSCRAAIAIGGEYGTLSEIALALKGGCPIILLKSWSLTPHGVIKQPDLLVAETPEEAVDMAIEQAQECK
jgi:uncharacterized protein (TIGR00725 family)